MHRRTGIIIIRLEVGSGEQAWHANAASGIPKTWHVITYTHLSFAVRCSYHVNNSKILAVRKR